MGLCVWYDRESAWTASCSVCYPSSAQGSVAFGAFSCRIEALRNLSKVLEQFIDATTFLSASRHPILSILGPVLHKILTTLEKCDSCCHQQPPVIAFQLLVLTLGSGSQHYQWLLIGKTMVGFLSSSSTYSIVKDLFLLFISKLFKSHQWAPILIMQYSGTSLIRTSGTSIVRTTQINLAHWQ